jgi:hypothetical protein
MTSYMLFAKERHESGDLKHMSISETGQRIAQEWSGLTESEKQVSWATRMICFCFIEANLRYRNTPNSRKKILNAIIANGDLSMVKILLQLREPIQSRRLHSSGGQ